MRATGSSSDGPGTYIQLRSELMQSSVSKFLLPEFIKKCRTLDQFWVIIKTEFDTYAERRKFIYEAFQPLLDSLETHADNPVNEDIESVLKIANAVSVSEAWEKISARKSNDPEGSITSARTMLESVCKHILDEREIEYEDKTDLPELYKKTSVTLNLAPSQHTEDVFKQILGGAHSVVQGLGSLRNKLGDAHGQGKARVKPLERHAKLAVNLAGAMSVFLIETHENTRAEESF